MTAIHVSAIVPRYAFVGLDQGFADRIATILTGAGWAHTTNLDGNLEGCDLIIAAGDVVFGVEYSRIPRLGLMMENAAGGRFDETIDPDAPDDAIGALAARWRPTPDAARFADVAASFGNAAIAPIARGLSAQLQQAIADLDSGSFAQAHRIAGLSGTLGFARTSAAWLAIDDGDTRQAPAARREARLAVAALERWLEVTGFARDSGA